MYAIAANTPEELKSAIVKWLKTNASNHRIRASQAVRITVRNHEMAMGCAYQDAADFIENCKIESKS